MNEAALKGKLCNLLRVTLQGCVVIRHEDRFTHGIPDISVTGNKKTMWLEAKHATPNFESKGIQELTMLRLARAGYAAYVVYWEKAKERRTYIVLPSDIAKDPSEWGEFVEGFSHSFVVDFVRETLK